MLLLRLQKINSMAKPAKFFVSLKLLLKKGNKILVLKEADTRFFDIPGGRIDENEIKAPIQKVLKREVREEIGADVKYKVLNFAPVAIHRRFKNLAKDRAFKIVFEAKYLSGDIKLSFEHESYEWVDPQKFNPKDWRFFSKEEKLAFEAYFKKVKKAAK